MRSGHSALGSSSIPTSLEGDVGAPRTYQSHNLDFQSLHSTCFFVKPIRQIRYNDRGPLGHRLGSPDRRGEFPPIRAKVLPISTLFPGN